MLSWKEKMPIFIEAVTILYDIHECHLPRMVEIYTNPTSEDDMIIDLAKELGKGWEDQIITIHISCMDLLNGDPEMTKKAIRDLQNMD